MQDGSISSAHCTCMAGLGEACSHIAIVLFYLISRPNTPEEQACTSRLAVWPVPAVKNVEMTRISDMEWSRSRSQGYKKDVAKMTQAETISFLRDLKVSAGVDPAICQLLEPFASEMANEELEDVMPESWEGLYNQTHKGHDYNTILKCLGTFNSTPFSEVEIIKIEDATKDQSQSKLWFKYRAGRITASKFKAVCRTTISKPSLTTIKSICYPEKVKFISKQTEYGLKNEKTALKEYENTMKNQHTEFVVSESGLNICKEYQQLGATPDAFVQCKCCGKGCVEIKCPYVLDSECKSLKEFSEIKNTCLIKAGNENVTLDKKHSYYYQIQMQMFVTKTFYCDFIIWCKSFIFTERIYFDDNFCAEHITKALNFHKYVIVPELIARHFTENIGFCNISCWCTCSLPDDGRPMIICDNEDCEIKWFHFECVGLKEIPVKYWFCHKCSN